MDSNTNTQDSEKKRKRNKNSTLSDDRKEEIRTKKSEAYYARKFHEQESNAMMQNKRKRPNTPEESRNPKDCSSKKQNSYALLCEEKKEQIRRKKREAYWRKKNNNLNCNSTEDLQSIEVADQDSSSEIQQPRIWIRECDAIAGDNRDSCSRVVSDKGKRPIEDYVFFDIGSTSQQAPMEDQHVEYQRHAVREKGRQRRNTVSCREYYSYKFQVPYLHALFSPTVAKSLLY